MKVTYASARDAGMFLGEQSQGMAGFIKEKIEDFGKQVGGTASNLYEQAMERFKDVTSGVTHRRFNAFKNQISHVFDPNVISYLNTVEEYQAAPPVMQDYIMSDPAIYGLAKDMVISGYSMDLDAIQCGENSKFYRAAVDGVYREDADGNFIIQRYFSIGDPILNGYEKSNVAAAWSKIKYMVEEQEVDPTSEWDEPLNI